MRLSIPRLASIIVVAIATIFLSQAISSSARTTDATARASNSAPNKLAQGNTLLSLSFDSSLNGAEGETPTTVNSVTIVPGLVGNAAQFVPGSQLYFPRTGNFNGMEGTVEAWVKPTWNGNDNVSHHLFSLPNSLEVFKSVDNHFICILQLTTGGVWAGFPASDWQAGKWRHIVCTWSNQQKRFTVYIDLVKRVEILLTANIAAPTQSTMKIGSLGDVGYFNGLVDEFSIRDVAIPEGEVARRFLAMVPVNSISTELTQLHLYPTWRWWPVVNANTGVGPLQPHPGGLDWSSSNASAAIVEGGRIRALAPGMTTLTATVQGRSFTIEVLVKPVAHAPEVRNIDPFLATPAVGHLYQMPVVVLRFLPTANGTTIDPAHSPELFSVSITELRSRIDRYDKQLKFQLEERSRYRAYKDPQSAPSLGYKIIKYIDIYEHTPPSRKYTIREGAPSYYVDWEALFERFDLAHYINDLGVKEIWYWSSNVDKGYGGLYNPAINRPEFLRTGWESNMSSPVSGDVSNSDRDIFDLPILNKTYTVWVPNPTRDDVNTHGNGHQLEAMLSWVNGRQDGNTDLFWNKFSGNSVPPPMRCGNTHYPPNGLSDYDYSNPNPVLSDIEDWRPDNAGQKKMTSHLSWVNLPFAWPDNVPPGGIDQAKYLLYWQQSMPGRGNTIPHGSNRMTNWWAFTGDWDAAISVGMGLYEPGSCNYAISATSQEIAVGGGSTSVNVSCVGGCKWIASSNETWIKVTSTPYGNGSGAVSLTVESNPAVTTRTGTVAIAEKVFTIYQAASGGPLEADVAPRPLGSGTVVVSDWVQVGRFSVGLDIATPGGEFQRADCAPRATSGDGQITVADWVQAGRYSVALDPLTSAGGPESPQSGAQSAVSRAAGVDGVGDRLTSVVRVKDAQFTRGQVGVLEIELDATGDENAVGFTLNFDAGKATFLEAVVVGNGFHNARVLANTSQSSQGRVAFAIALPTGGASAAGKQTLLTIRFASGSGEASTNMQIEFDDSIITREVVAPDARRLPEALFRGGTVVIDPKLERRRPLFRGVR